MRRDSDDPSDRGYEMRPLAMPPAWHLQPGLATEGGLQASSGITQNYTVLKQPPVHDVQQTPGAGGGSIPVVKGTRLIIVNGVVTSILPPLVVENSGSGGNGGSGGSGGGGYPAPTLTPTHGPTWVPTTTHTPTPTPTPTVTPTPTPTHPPTMTPTPTLTLTPTIVMTFTPTPTPPAPTPPPP